MKKIICILLLCLLTLFGASCAEERHSLLYSKEIDGLTYCIRGNGNRPKQLVIKRGDQVRWSDKTSVSRKRGNLDGDYGLQVLDLNFDGNLDVMLPTSKDGDCISYECWLKNTEGDGYTRSASLSALCNVAVDEELLAVFGFSHTMKREELSDGSEHTVSTDITTKYVWRKGQLQPQIRALLSYYAQSNLY